MSVLLDHDLICYGQKKIANFIEKEKQVGNTYLRTDGWQDPEDRKECWRQG